jgi:hypothetical protein
MRVNPGAGFAYLFQGEGNRITLLLSCLTVKYSCFIKKTNGLYPQYVRSRPYIRMDGVIALYANVFTKRYVQYTV